MMFALVEVEVQSAFLDVELLGEREHPHEASSQLFLRTLLALPLPWEDM
jgi:hypothetical protein